MCIIWLAGLQGYVSDRLLKKLTQALANAAEERGTDASGIAYVKNSKVTIFKRPKPAHKIRFNAPNGTRAVMGHTRMTTQGNEKFNYNNHPFYGHADVNFAFAHNGVLYNDKNLRVEKHLPNTQIETDSYVAVQLLEQQGKLVLARSRAWQNPCRAVSALPLWTKTTRSTSSRAAIPCVCSTLQSWDFTSTPQRKAF